MSRKSERELEHAVEELGGDANMTREWAERYLERTIAERGFNLEYDANTETSPAAGRVPVLESGNGFVFFAPRSALPAWIDVETLPVSA